MSRFTGFPRGTFDFLADLALNNNRDWFEANRDRYDAFWKAPALDFIAALGPGMAAMAPPLIAEPRLNASLRRINRDTRFAADKTPYEPWLHLIFWPGGAPNNGAGFHFVLRAGGIGYGAGRYGFDAPTLERYRARVSDPAARAPLMAALEQAAGAGCPLGEPHLQKVPQGHVATGEAARLLRYKGIVARTPTDGPLPPWVHGPEAIEEVLALCRPLMPLIGWLHAL